LVHLAPLDRDPAIVRPTTISGLSGFLDRCADHDTDYVPTESVSDRRKRKVMEKEKKAKTAVENGLEQWDPNTDPRIVSDPFKTLFVGRLNYETTEKELRREFERYGPVTSVRLVYDSTAPKQSRGYAFIEFEREKDVVAAYRDADGIKLDGRRIIVDVERGRTVKDWRPRRLSGGLGRTRIGGSEENQRHSGRDGGPNAAASGPPPPSSYGGGGGGSSGRYRDRDDGYKSGVGYRGSSGGGGGGGGRYDDRRSGDRDRGDRDRDRNRERERDRGGYDRRPDERYGGGGSGGGSGGGGYGGRPRSRSPRRDYRDDR
ncbi:hypothetical protein HK405_009382, partial [Cladochytrium tenue]